MHAFTVMTVALVLASLVSSLSAEGELRTAQPGLSAPVQLRLLDDQLRPALASRDDADPEPTGGAHWYGWKGLLLDVPIAAALVASNQPALADRWPDANVVLLPAGLLTGPVIYVLESGFTPRALGSLGIRALGAALSVGWAVMRCGFGPCPTMDPVGLIFVLLPYAFDDALLMWR